MASSLSLCVGAHRLFESNQIHKVVQKEAVLNSSMTGILSQASILVRSLQR